MIELNQTRKLKPQMGLFEFVLSASLTQHSDRVVLTAPRSRPGAVLWSAGQPDVMNSMKNRGAGRPQCFRNSPLRSLGKSAQRVGIMRGLIEVREYGADASHVLHT